MKLTLLIIGLLSLGACKNEASEQIKKAKLEVGDGVKVKGIYADNYSIQEWKNAGGYVVKYVNAQGECWARDLKGKYVHMDFKVCG